MAVVVEPGSSTLSSLYVPTSVRLDLENVGIRSCSRDFATITGLPKFPDSRVYMGINSMVNTDAPLQPMLDGAIWM